MSRLFALTLMISNMIAISAMASLEPSLAGKTCYPNAPMGVATLKFVSSSEVRTIGGWGAPMTFKYAIVGSTLTIARFNLQQKYQIQDGGAKLVDSDGIEYNCR